MRFSFINLVAFTAIVLLAAALLSCGCSEDGTDFCLTALTEIDSIEKAADNRLKVMDFSNADDIFLSQMGASENQYREAIDELYNLGETPCLSGFSYEARVKSLQFKIDFLDVTSALIEADSKAGAIFQTSTPEFRKGLIEVLNDYENIRQRIIFLRIMGGDIDTTLLNPEFTGIIEVVDGKLAQILESVDSKVSFLREYK